jgi:hypothetical protein
LQREVQNVGIVEVTTKAGMQTLGRTLVRADSPEGLHVVQLVAIQAETFLPFASVSTSPQTRKALSYNLHSAHERIVDVVLV